MIDLIALDWGWRLEINDVGNKFREGGLTAKCFQDGCATLCPTVGMLKGQTHFPHPLVGAFLVIPNGRSREPPLPHRVQVACTWV